MAFRGPTKNKNITIIQTVTIYVTIYENNDLITKMAVNERADIKQGRVHW